MKFAEMIHHMTYETKLVNQLALQVNQVGLK